MPFERRTIDGVDWFICHGQAQQRFRGAAALLQSEYGRAGNGYVWGKGRGCWEALWLAEQYNVRMLILEACSLQIPEKALRRPAMRNLFAVVCPVLICDGQACDIPDLPNATVYRIDHAERLPEAIQALMQRWNANEL